MTPAELDALWDFNDPAASEARFRHFHATQSDPELKAEALTQLARSLGLQRRFDEAQAVLDEITGGSPRVQVRRLLEQGRLLNSSGNRPEAQGPFEAAWSLACDSGLDALAVDAAHMVAISTDGDEQLAWNERAIEFAQQSEDPGARKWLGSLYNNTGWSYHDRGEYERALVLFVIARDLREANGEIARERVARWCVARCLRSMGRSEEALTMQRALLAEQPESDGYIEEELGELLLGFGRASEASAYFAAAYEKLSKDSWLAEREPERLSRLRALASG